MNASLLRAPTARFRIVHPVVRAIVGAIAAACAACAGAILFGPFSDLSALQLAAGPRATTPWPDGRPLVLARTGRTWGAPASERTARDSSASRVLLAGNQLGARRAHSISGPADLR